MLTHECKGNASYKHLSIKQENIDLYYKNKSRIFATVPIFFLLLNIFLGIIGTFWFRTQHRRAEIALRMALGSTRWGICGRLMGEGVLLLLISAIPALVVAWNLGYAELVEVTRMPFTAGRFAITVLGTFILIAGMIVIGIGYPARRAMSIEPAEALHEE